MYFNNWMSVSLNGFRYSSRSDGSMEDEIIRIWRIIKWNSSFAKFVTNNLDAKKRHGDELLEF